MWMFIAGASFGCVAGFLAFALCAAGRGEDCLNCAGLIQREEDIRSLTKSRDILRNRCDQLEIKVHALKSSNGKLAQEVQRTVFLTQREA